MRFSSAQVYIFKWQLVCKFGTMETNILLIFLALLIFI